MRGALGRATVDLRHDAGGERGEYREILARPFVWRLVQCAQRTQHMPVVGGERNAGIGPYPASDWRQILLRQRISHYERLSARNHILAERSVEVIPAGR